MGKLRAEMVCVCVVNPNLVKPWCLSFVYGKPLLPEFGL